MTARHPLDLTNVTGRPPRYALPSKFALPDIITAKGDLARRWRGVIAASTHDAS
jgi:hypothetical protein